MERFYIEIKKIPKQVLVGIIILLIIPFWIFFISPYFNNITNNLDISYELISTQNEYDTSTKNFKGEEYLESIYTLQTSSENIDTSIVEGYTSQRAGNQIIYEIKNTFTIDRLRNTYVDYEEDIYLFAPKNLEEGKSFKYIHLPFNIPTEMSYIGKKQIYGVEIYEYKSDYNKQKVNLSDNFEYLEGVGNFYNIKANVELTLWVEPVTGSLINFIENVNADVYSIESGEVLYPLNYYSTTINE